MQLKPLLRNVATIGLIGLGGVLGAAAVVWVRSNSDWVTVRLPAEMAPGSARDVEYEARVWGIAAIAFCAGLLSTFWIALAVWLRALRRERRLARTLERLDQQVEAKRTIREDALIARHADFDDLEAEDAALLVAPEELPEGYEAVDDDEDEEEVSRG